MGHNLPVKLSAFNFCFWETKINLAEFCILNLKGFVWPNSKNQEEMCEYFGQTSSQLKVFRNENSLECLIYLLNYF